MRAEAQASARNCANLYGERGGIRILTIADEGTAKTYLNEHALYI